jgi:hypothetical protein
LVVGKFAAEHGSANGYATADILSVIGVVLLHRIIVKKLLVDSWWQFSASPIDARLEGSERVIVGRDA